MVIIDGNNLIHKSFHGMPFLSTSTGIPVNAVYGSLNTIRSIITQLQPKYITVVFDSGNKTFRHQLDPNYKAHRPPTSGQLKSQFDLLKVALRCLGIPYMTAEHDAEGDDITASLAWQTTQIGIPTTIVSSDKDFFSLLDNPLLKVYSYHIAKKNPNDAFADKNYVLNKFDIEPSKLNHIKALTGEKSDNIAGVPGIGPKTAHMLIKKHDNIHQLLDYMEQNVKDKYHWISEHRNIVELAYKLASIRTDVAVPDCKILPVNKIKIEEEVLRDFFKGLEMKQFLNNFPLWKNLFNYKV